MYRHCESIKTLNPWWDAQVLFSENLPSNGLSGLPQGRDGTTIQSPPTQP